MKRKICAFLLTVVMLITSAVPVFAEGASGGTSFTDEERAEIQAREDQQFAEYLKTDLGQAWLATEEGQAWLNTEAGKRTIENYGPINIPEASNTQGSDKNQNQPTQGGTTVSGTGKFTDVPDDAWYATAVNAMADSGILSGYGDGTFRPNQNITVGELSVILWRLCGVTDPEETYDYQFNRPKYADVAPKHWASPYVLSAAGAWLNGIVDRAPTVEDCSAVATRGQAIDALMDVFKDLKLLDTEIQKNGLNLEIIRTPNPDKDKNPLLPDIYTVSNNYIGDWETAVIKGYDWDGRNIVDAYNYSVINGVNDSHDCNPASNITRAELITMIYNTGVSSWPKALDHLVGHCTKGGCSICEDAFTRRGPQTKAE